VHRLHDGQDLDRRGEFVRELPSRPVRAAVWDIQPWVLLLLPGCCGGSHDVWLDFWSVAALGAAFGAPQVTTVEHAECAAKFLADISAFEAAIYQEPANTTAVASTNVAAFAATHSSNLK